ncbi:hypothetical protein TRP8649_02085 [Pelagimonas phthalicica]|uniref:Uncharacterized protein n=1 Tax=Pelagimonas phthalicica TaxID=1037362 RepID=A0A238JC65_9RHOB|nr:hypothetical protein [Pelagimonas phthalicica]TDS90926.1 hypothetical protein CLV87_2087 [Pelagimonas phthalicica]SMX27973.1 hypothetical protein TRP8649_02085 [Pelagimonas phthalicica]
MKKIISGILLASLGLLSTPVMAKGTAYECKVKDVRSQGYWLPEVLFIGHDPDEDVVVVSDPIILHYNDSQPVGGKLSVDNDKRTTFTWRLKVKTSSGQFARVSYRATYYKKDGTLSISAKPLNYTNRFNGRGTCEVKALK